MAEKRPETPETAEKRPPQDQEPNRPPGPDPDPVRDPVTGQFRPGHTGNPAGRPKGRYSITRRLRDMLEEAVKGSDEKIGDRLTRTILVEALKGNWPFVQEVINRNDGKVPDIVISSEIPGWDVLPDDEAGEEATS